MQQQQDADLDQQQDSVIELLVNGAVRYFIDSSNADTPFNSSKSLDDGLSSSRTDRSL